MTGQHRQPKARTTPRRPGTPMYTDQCCEDMLKARTPHTTMQNAPKAKAENAADQSMPKRGLWESNEAAISPETMRRGCHASAHSAARAVRLVGPRFHSASQGLNAPGG